MAELMVMPKLGLTATEGTLVNWLSEVGDEITSGAPICEVETDKITIEVECPFSGVLLRRIDPDVIVPVGEPVAVIGAAGEDASRFALFDPSRRGEETAAAEPGAKAEGQPTPPRSRPKPMASPVARRLAEELGVDLSEVPGTGPGGLINRQDVERAAAGRSVAVEKPSPMRRAIAAAMTGSAAVPQFSLERDVDVGLILERLEGIGGHQAIEDRPTIADAIAAALARALARHPEFLRSWTNEGYHSHDEVNLGLAVAVPGGLVVPVVPKADTLSVVDLTRQRRALQEKAVAGKLSAVHLTGAVFTLSNLGPLGVDRFRALVNPPESGILTVGRVVDRGGRRQLTLGLSGDHRVVDGADGARLLADAAAMLEEPEGIDALLSGT